MPIQLIGYIQLDQKFEKLKKVSEQPDARLIFGRRAQELRDAIRAEEPTDKGTLAKATVSFATRRGEAAAFVKVNIFQGQVKARHGLYIAFGTRDHGPKFAKAMSFDSAGNQVYTRRVRGVRPNPFFQRGLQNAGARVTLEISDDLKRLVESQ
mgnify:CR=1 FL=1